MDRVDWETISHQEFDQLIRITEFPFINTPVKNQENLTPLSLACKFKREDLVTVLLWHNAKTDTEYSPRGKQPLHYACNSFDGNKGIVRKLLKAGANINSQDMYGNTGLYYACSKTNHPVVELLCESGANVNLPSDNETPLIIACQRDQLAIVHMLLLNGADANMCYGEAMEIAIMKKSYCLIEVLVVHGTNLNHSKFLSLACEHSDMRTMRFLIDHGVDVNKHDNMGMTPLHNACFNPRTKTICVHFLLHHGAQVDPRSNRYTPLHYAVIHRNLHKVRMLLSYGANVNLLEAFVLCSMMKEHEDSRRLYISEKYIVIFKLLIAAGIRLTLSDLNDLKERVSYTEMNSSKVELEELIEELTKGPFSLKFLCRITIRSNVNPVVDDNLKTLPLPGNVIKYLNFSDFLEDPSQHI